MYMYIFYLKLCNTRYRSGVCGHQLVRNEHVDIPEKYIYRNTGTGPRREVVAGSHAGPGHKSA